MNARARALWLLVGALALTARAQADPDARFSALLQQELRRRATLESGEAPSAGALAAFAEAGDDGVIVADELVRDGGSARAALGRALRAVTKPTVRPPSPRTESLGCAALSLGPPRISWSHAPPPPREPPPAASQRDTPRWMAPRERRARARELWERADPRDVPELLRFVRDADSTTRLTAACALATRGDARGVPVLLRALEARQDDQSQMLPTDGPDAEVALRTLTGIDAAAHVRAPPRQEGDHAFRDDRPPDQVAAAWRAWWEANGEGFDALRTHVALLATGDEAARSRCSMAILGSRGDLGTARALLEAHERLDGRTLASALCGIAARHAGVIELIATMAREEAEPLRRHRALDALRHVAPAEAEGVLLDVATTGNVADLGFAMRWCCCPQKRCSRRIVEALLARAPYGADDDAIAAYRALGSIVGRSDCPRLMAVADDVPHPARDVLQQITKGLGCLDRGIVLRILPEGDLALQWWTPRGESGDGELVGEPFVIEGTRGRASEDLWPEEDAGVDAFPDPRSYDPAMRRSRACASAAMAGARTTVGLVMILRGDDPQLRALAAGSLERLAEVRDEIAPECASSPAASAAPLDQPYVRAQLEASARGSDPDVARLARRILELLDAPP